MSDVVKLADRRPPTCYTIHIAHHWDGKVEVMVEDLADDARSREAVGYALKLATETFYPETQKEGRNDLPPLTEEELQAALEASWETARPYIRDDLMGGRDPGPWSKRPERQKNISRLEIAAAYNAVMEVRRQSGREPS